MARLAEEARGGADEDERPLPVAELGEEAAGGEEGRGQIGVERLAPALERELGDRNVLGRPDAGDRGAGVELSRLGEHPLDVGLLAKIGLDDAAAAGSFGALPAAVVVDDDLGPLGGEQAHAGGADSAGAAGDEYACALKTCLHPPRKRFSIPRSCCRVRPEGEPG